MRAFLCTTVVFSSLWWSHFGSLTSLSSFVVQTLLLCSSLDVSLATRSTAARSRVGVVFSSLWLWWSDLSLCLAGGRFCCCHYFSAFIVLTPSLSEVVGDSVCWSSVLRLTVFCFVPLAAVWWLCVFVLQGHRSFFVRG